MNNMNGIDACEIDSALQKLGSEIIAINTLNGWDVTQPTDWRDALNIDSEAVNAKWKIPTKLALIHSEISEALEAFRVNDRENFIEEMGDAIIRILDCTHGLGMNVGKSIIVKLAKNRTRGFRHGNKIV